MPQQSGRRPRAGFTLLELIVIVVVAGFLGALLVQMLGTQLLRSGDPVVTAKESAQAEADLEGVVAYYASRVNTNLSGALDDVKTRYSGNSTVSFTADDANWQGTGVRVLTVTATAGGSRLTTLLTQSRTNAADDATNF
jgi:type II secretory pathway pseudopilin PulG